ncbi:MAG: alpha/beta hydrolase [Dehalococcoidia bacterium]
MSSPADDDLELRILRVLGSPGEEEGSFRLRLETSRGPIDGIFHAVEGGTGAVIFVGGAIGGLDGPADRLFARLPAVLAAAEISSLRIDYRAPNEFEECVLDLLAACSFLKGVGATNVVLVGHSFGGAVVIKAGELAPIACAVAALSPQLHGTRQVENLGKPLLLVHGAADSVLDSEASEDIYRRAEEPKQIVLFADTGHSLFPAKKRLEVLLKEWIPARLAGEPMATGRREWMADD